jgi:hypothetical protein
VSGKPVVPWSKVGLKMAIEIVDLPIENGDFLSFFVCLPEGIIGGFSSFQACNIGGLSLALPH